MVIGRLYDYDTEVLIEQGLFKTHITVERKGEKIEVELDKYKLQQLINLLEKCKGY